MLLFPPEPAGLPCLHGGVAVSLPGLGLEAVCWLAALQGCQGSAVGMLLFWISLQIARPKLGLPRCTCGGLYSLALGPRLESYLVPGSKFNIFREEAYSLGPEGKCKASYN